MLQKSTAYILYILLVAILISSTALSSKESRAYSLSEYCTCKGVMNEYPWGYVEKTSKFTTSDVMVFLWVKISHVTKAHRVSFKWIHVDKYGGKNVRYEHGWETEDPASHGYSYYEWYALWDYIPVNSPDSIGDWEVIMKIDGETLFTAKFEVLSDVGTSPIEGTITTTVYSTIPELTITTVYVTHTYIVSSVYGEFISPFREADIFLLSSIIISSAVISAYILRWRNRKKPKLEEHESKYLKYLAKLEELKITGRIDEKIYRKLREEYSHKSKIP
jgi:hypothetical protein